MEITSQNPQWQMEDMPGPRVMGDMVILPTAQILIINGAKNGTAGWQLAREPALTHWQAFDCSPSERFFIILASSSSSTTERAGDV